MWRTFFSVVACVGAAPVLAQAECPTSDDLHHGGIRLTQPDPMIVADYAIAEDGTLVAERTTHTPDGEVEGIERLEYLHPLLTPARITPTFRTSVSASADVSSLGELAESISWNTTLTVLTTPTAGSEPEFEALLELDITVSYHGQSTLILGACQYDVWEVLVTTGFEGGGRGFLRYQYAPDLGLPISAAQLTRGGVWGREWQSFYSFETIEARS